MQIWQIITHPNNAIRYNSMFNQWESMAPMPVAVLHPAVAATNQRIYMFGGEDTLQNPVRIIQVRHCGFTDLSSYPFSFIHSLNLFALTPAPPLPL